MSFKKLVKKSIKSRTEIVNREEPGPKHTQKNSDGKIYPTQTISSGKRAGKTGFKERLYTNNADGLVRIASWFPFFAGAWLVSGIVLNQLLLLSFIIAPHLAIAIFTKLKREHKVPFEREMSLMLSVAIIIDNLLIYDWYDSIIIPCISLIAATLYYTLENSAPGSVRGSILRASNRALFPALLAQLGVMSQTHLSDKTSFIYMILGLVPGTVLGAREIILAYPIFKKAGWQLNGGEISKPDKKKITGENPGDEKINTGKFKPGGFTRLVLAFILLGPIIPSLLLPFRVLPETFLLSSLIFMVFPKLAEITQNQPENYSLLSIHLANVAAILAVIMLIAGFLAQML